MHTYRIFHLDPNYSINGNSMPSWHMTFERHCMYVETTSKHNVFLTSCAGWDETEKFHFSKVLPSLISLENGALRIIKKTNRGEGTKLNTVIIIYHRELQNTKIKILKSTHHKEPIRSATVKNFLGGNILPPQRMILSWENRGRFLMNCFIDVNKQRLE